MGLRPVGAKLRRKISAAAETEVVQAAGGGGWTFSFTTADHRHGWWDKRTDEIQWRPTNEHRSSCRELFPEEFSRPT